MSRSITTTEESLQRPRNRLDGGMKRQLSAGAAIGGDGMSVLIACEESQTVCIAFRKFGIEAYSCDIQEPSGGHPEWHILGDALEAVRGGGK